MQRFVEMMAQSRGRSASGVLTCMDPVTKTIRGLIHLQARFGSRAEASEQSNNAEAWKAAVGTAKQILAGKGAYCVVKFMPLKPNRDLPEHLRYPQDWASDRYGRTARLHETWVELAGLEITREFVRQRISPNFTLLYDYGICPSTMYENPELAHKYNGMPSIIFASEVADGNHRGWVAAKKRTLAEIRVATFDVLNAVVALYRYLAAFHHDLHHGNVLYFNPPPLSVGTWTRHWIGGLPYLREGGHALHVLWDYQFMTRPGVFPVAPWVAPSFDEKEADWRVTKSTYDYAQFFHTSLYEEAAEIGGYELPLDVREWLLLIEDHSIRGTPPDKLLAILFDDWVEGRLSCKMPDRITDEFSIDKVFDIPAAMCKLKVFLPGTTNRRECESDPTRIAPYLAEVAHSSKRPTQKLIEPCGGGSALRTSVPRRAQQISLEEEETSPEVEELETLEEQMVGSPSNASRLESLMSRVEAHPFRTRNRKPTVTRRLQHTGTRRSQKTGTRRSQKTGAGSTRGRRSRPTRKSR